MSSSSKISSSEEEEQRGSKKSRYSSRRKLEEKPKKLEKEVRKSKSTWRSHKRRISSSPSTSDSHIEHPGKIRDRNRRGRSRQRFSVSKHAGRRSLERSPRETSGSSREAMESAERHPRVNSVTGYEIPFHNLPYQFSEPPEPLLTPEDESRMLKAILNLKNIGAVVCCPSCERQFLSSYFLRPKIEDMKTAICPLNRNYFMGVIDLKDAYLMVPAAQKHRKFLRFFFNNEFYEFQCLPFGLSTAPFVFTKLLKPVAQKVRSSGILMVIYLDDILILAKSEDECRTNILKTRSLLESLGFLVSNEKSQLEPSQRCVFLGFILDSKAFRIELTETKRNSIYQRVLRFLRDKKCSIQELAQFIGTLVSACPTIRYGWLYTKRLEREKFLGLRRFNNNYKAKITLSSLVQPDLEWWEKKIQTSSNAIREHKYKREVFTDASLTGWGAGEKANGLWNQEERSLHINELELIAAFLGLKRFIKNDRNCEILLRMDNTTSIAYINRMGGIQHPHLTQVARQIWHWCEERDLWFLASYLPSRDNKEADEGSRLLPKETEWELVSWAFKKINKTLGPFEVDFFASREIAPAESQSFPGGSSVIREAFKSRGATEEAADIMFQSIAAGTLRQYNKPIKLWWKHCSRIGVNPYKSSIPDALNFFAKTLEGIKSYSVINTYRAAVSLITGGDVGSDNSISRFFKGAAVLRPRKYKYDVTWDPKPVLDQLASWYPHEGLSLEILTKKLVTLLALITAQRVQTLTAIRIENINVESELICIKITHPIKTSTRSKFHPMLEIPRFSEKPELCAASSLCAYIEKTTALREDENKGELFLTL
ncbi:uncharacterized protein LOC122502395 [Leptopilina heterotoma]|uniref:uncharacterized protein LOC122502395 n=1 Tax=Leptopilina heterotoma TaxID=63436 RepID=UPI001CA7F402|nr:uncharacterized protein LOC122502395 [Leptopilina heterotoma]